MYRLPPPPTPGSALREWHLDPYLAVLVLALATAYAIGLVALRRKGKSWPARRTVMFYGPGILGLAVVSMGWPAVYAPALFSVYATQLVLLLMAVPLLLAIGRPIELLMSALPERGRERLTAILESRPAKLLTVPVVSPLLLAVIPFVVFFTPWYAQSLTHPLLLSATRVLLPLVGLAVLVPLWEADTIAARFPYALALLCAFIELLADAVPGIVIRLDTQVIAAGWWLTLARPWGGSPLSDQQLGGDLLWCLGEAIDVPFLALLLIQWVRSDAREAARVDAALDGPSLVSIDEGESGSDRPWWERDASVFGDRAGQFRRPD
jgi:putative copper resistance protein D